MHGYTDFLTEEQKDIFFGTQNAQTYTEFNLLAKRAEDLRAQRYWGFCRDAIFCVRSPHGIPHRFFDISTEGHILNAHAELYFLTLS